MLNAWRPSEEPPITHQKEDKGYLWVEPEVDAGTSSLDSYII
jgi:hypothetical protein